MKYSTVAEAYDAMEQTTKRLELTDILASLFTKTDPHVIDKVVYLTQGKICPDHVGLELGIAEKLAIKALATVASRSLESVQELYKKTGDMGLTAEEVLREKSQMTLFSEPLTVERVHETFERMARATGPGSIETKIRYLVSLLNDASPKEAKHIMRTVMGQLRLGVADYTVLDALAQAFIGDRSRRSILEKAYNISSDLGAVAKAVANGGLEAIQAFRIEVGRPIRPMLAERLESAEEVLEKLGGRGAAEYKLDGERLQIHKKADQIRLFTRRLEEVSHHYPDVIELCNRRIRSKEAILEGEAVAINVETGEYLPFQELMHRRRKYGIEEAMKEYPVALHFFDALYHDGRDLTNEPYTERRRVLESLVEEDERAKLVPAKLVTNSEELESFMEEAIAAGCEGLMVKDLDSIYRAGAREFAWIKLKREYRSELTDTLDLVMIGAFHGRGRRAGKYGAFLLAAFDKEQGIWRSICKIGTGFSDEDLERFPELLKPYIMERRHPLVDSKMEPDVWLEPKLVIEVIASEVTLSPIHTAALDAIRPGKGLALRFPKYTGRLREDKGPEDATTVQEVVEIYKRQLKRIQASSEIRIGEEGS